MKLKLGFAVVLLGVALWQVAKLPPPYATRSAVNPPEVIPRPAGAGLHLPPGFKIEVFAEGFREPRYMILGPSGKSCSVTARMPRTARCMSSKAGIERSS